FLAKVDGDAGITVFGLGRPVRATGRADADGHPELAGRRDFVPERVRAGEAGGHGENSQSEAGDARHGSAGHEIPSRGLLLDRAFVSAIVVDRPAAENPKIRMA